MKNRVWTLMVVAVLCLVILLSSCSGSGGTDTPSTGTPDADIPDDVKMVRYTMTLTPTLDPAVGSDYSSCVAFVNLYDTLVYPTKDGSVKPWVATEWSVSDDGLIWEFKLRDDVTFHSGNKLTAHDVKYSMDRAITIGEGFGFLFYDTIKETIVADDYTVQFVCNKPFGPFLSIMTRLYIVDSQLLEANLADGPYDDKGDYGRTYLLDKDAGSGAYKVKEYKQNIHLWAERYPDYWAGFHENNPDEFICIGSNEPVTVKTMMSRQELEIADHYLPYETIASMSEIPGVKIGTVPMLGNGISLTLNNQLPPTDCVHFRRAIGYLIDYDNLISGVYPGATKARSVVHPSLEGYVEMFDFEFDLDKAREELALSKYADNLDAYPMELAWTAEVPSNEKLALVIQSAAQQVGLPIDVQKVPWATLIERSATIETTPNAETLMLSPSTLDAGTTFMSFIRSKDYGTWEGVCWVNNPEIDAMIDDAIATIDRTERIKKYEEIQYKLAEIVPYIPITEYDGQHAYQASYMEWDGADPELAVPLMGYGYDMRGIRVYPERKAK